MLLNFKFKHFKTLVKSLFTKYHQVRQSQASLGLRFSYRVKRLLANSSFPINYNVLSHIFQMKENKYFSDVMISFIGCQHSKKNKKMKGKIHKAIVAEGKKNPILSTEHKKRWKAV